ncbi:hypothetical protein BDV95DRAFT_268392 [Massariosphaeria phaeospora]|uniref:Uncharacterized protein n=1 Tax=Massariosphaeria phaeospora TaxID=100035 RepID=A0A7C8HYD3_9PLEO|nr:hypothetical protein BDV95DRAFT_268392 [Massariosphaeria phaeospora]
MHRRAQAFAEAGNHYDNGIAATRVGSPVPEASDSCSTNECTRNLDSKILLPTDYEDQSPQTRTLCTTLADHGIDTLFELRSSRARNSTSLQVPSYSPSFSANNIVKGTLLWEASSTPGGSELYDTLCDSGWRPVYMRGCDAGQTWYHGPDPVHVRFLQPDYVPQLGNPRSARDTGSYLLIGSQWIEEDALKVGGYDYRYLPLGFCVLEPDLRYVRTCFPLILLLGQR